ncbi:response regulator transcription factor [Spongorhabdus nitratireducens]
MITTNDASAVTLENKKILVVEDEQEIGNLLSLHLGDMGAEIHHASDGFTGLELATQQPWDLIILDIQLPGPSGLDICRRVRKTNRQVPIILLTSRTTELDRVVGLDVGADDYISKPFGMMELIARIKALLRRSGTQPAPELPQSNPDLPVRINNLEVKETSRQVHLSGKEIELTAREFDLLMHFVRHPGRVFSRTELLDQVWGYNHEGYEHTVNSHINRLRAKLESDPRNPEYIVTCWGVGYKLQDHRV